MFTRRVTLPQPTDDGHTIARQATELLYRSGPKEAIRLIGVGCTGLTAESADQLPLFGAETKSKRETLNQTLDEITRRFGRKAIGELPRTAREQVGLSMQVKRGDDPEE